MPPGRYVEDAQAEPVELEGSGDAADGGEPAGPSEEAIADEPKKDK